MTDKAVHIALYPSDWLAGTRGLTPAETGVYITLVCMMYERQEPLSFDHARLARMCNCPAGTFKKLLAVLLDEGKLFETPDGLWNKRVEKEIGAARTAIDEASDRAKRAADARWSKVGKQSGECENVTVKPQSDQQQVTLNAHGKSNENNDSTMHGHCPSNANQNQNQRYKKESADALLSDRPDQTSSDRPKGDDLQPAIDAFNEAASEAGWPSMQKLTPQRRAALKARLAEAGGIDGWCTALAKARASPHLCGQNDRGWVASFDFITRQSSFAKLMEGNYDPRSSAPRSGSPRSSQSGRGGQPGGLVGAAMRSRAGS